MVEQVYRARQPKASPLWQCLSRHFDAFLEGYEERYQSRYGFLRPTIPEVVNKFLLCGDLEQGFARARMLRGGVHSGFNVHRSRRVLPEQRDKRAAEEIQTTGNAVAVIDVSEHEPRRIPSAKWRELINPPSPRLRWTVGRFCNWLRCPVRRSFSVGG